MSVVRFASVALRKESVDRNIGSRSQKPNFLASLSARRAWIEIVVSMALDQYLKSLSARRAWIEIRLFVWIAKRALVALRKESVDRNIIVYVKERGIKLSLSARRAWIEI